MNNYPDNVSSNDPNAPWNQDTSEQDFIETDVEVSISLSKTLTIQTDDYIESIEEDYDVDIDEEGNRVIYGGKYPSYDFSETNWIQSYINDECYILTLLEEYGEILKQDVIELEETIKTWEKELKEDPGNLHLKKEIKRLKGNIALKKFKIDACTGYTVDDLEVFEA